MEMNEEIALSLQLHLHLKQVLETKYGEAAGRLSAAIINDITMRPSGKDDIITFCRDNNELIEETRNFIKHFPDIIDTLSALLDLINMNRRNKGEHDAANACVERARKYELYIEDSPGKKEILSHCDGSLDGIDVNTRSVNKSGCLGVLLAFVGFSSLMLTAIIILA